MKTKILIILLISFVIVYVGANESMQQASVTTRQWLTSVATSQMRHHTHPVSDEAVEKLATQWEISEESYIQYVCM